MSFSVFVAICLIGVWALMPISLVIAMSQFDKEQQDSDHH